MHILVAHMPKFLKDIGSLALFSQQGHKKLNNDIIKVYFKSTNHWNEYVLRCLEELTDEQYCRIKHLHIQVDVIPYLKTRRLCVLLHYLKLPLV